MKPVYLGEWSSNDDLARDFCRDSWGKDAADEFLNSDAMRGIEVLLAYYSYEGYEGDAFVLFRRAGKLYEINGGHCSCYGLEGQWEPSETSVAELRKRMDDGHLGQTYEQDEKFSVPLRAILDELEASL